MRGDGVTKNFRKVFPKKAGEDFWAYFLHVEETSERSKSLREKPGEVRFVGKRIFERGVFVGEREDIREDFASKKGVGDSLGDSKNREKIKNKIGK